MIVAKVTTPVADADGHRPQITAPLHTGNRNALPRAQRDAQSAKLPVLKRPMFQILGLHPGYGSRFLAAACIVLAFILAAPTSHAGWSHGSSGGSRSHHARSSSGGTHRSHHRKSY